MIFSFKHKFEISVYDTKNFYQLIRKSVQNDEQWLLFYCDSTLSCGVIRDLDLCKLDDFWRHNVDTKWCEIAKMEYLWRLLLYKTETLYRPSPLKRWKQSFPPTRSAISPCWLCSECERIWALHSTSKRKSVRLWRKTLRH